MAVFDDIVAGVDVEPVDVAMLRVMLAEDWGHGRECDPAVRLAAHRVIDETVDLLRSYWGPRGFDRFVEADTFVD